MKKLLTYFNKMFEFDREGIQNRSMTALRKYFHTYVGETGGRNKGLTEP